MRELQAQSLVVKAVNERGGKAFKMSNRFLVGVVDLFVQMQRCPTYVYEVKLNKTKFNKDAIKVDLTKPQEKFIRGCIEAGGRAGTISFVQDGHDLWFAALQGAHVVVPRGSYTLLERGHREQRIYELLYKVERDRA